MQVGDNRTAKREIEAYCLINNTKPAGMVPAGFFAQMEDAANCQIVRSRLHIPRQWSRAPRNAHCDILTDARNNFSCKNLWPGSPSLQFGVFFRPTCEG